MLVSTSNGRVDTTTGIVAVLIEGNQVTDPTSWSLVYVDPVTNQILGFTNASYTSLANLQSALSDFVATAGWPWLAVGDPTAYPPGSNGTVRVPVAVNLNLVTGWADAGTGIQFSGPGVSTIPNATQGYAPWGSFAVAETLLPLSFPGVYTFS